jgi:hypothetical protein
MMNMKTQTDFLRAEGAQRRKAHFASGGDLATWRGIHTVQKDRRKEASRKACRNRTREEA